MLHTLGQEIGVDGFLLGALTTAEPTEETASRAVAGSIVVSGARAEAVFLASMAN